MQYVMFIKFQKDKIVLTFSRLLITHYQCLAFRCINTLLSYSILWDATKIPDWKSNTWEKIEQANLYPSLPRFDCFVSHTCEVDISWPWRDSNKGNVTISIKENCQNARSLPICIHISAFNLSLCSRWYWVRTQSRKPILSRIENQTVSPISHSKISAE